MPTLEEALRHLQSETKDEEIETDPRVMEMVREQLGRERPPPLAALYGRAVRINPEIRKLTPRQFNARYPLQVRRRMRARAARRSGRSRATSGNGGQPASSISEASSAELRGRLRAILWAYARLVAAAGTKAELVAAVSAADRFVDDVVEAYGGAGNGR